MKIPFLKFKTLASIGLLALTIASCSNDDEDKMLSLYEKLGGFSKVQDPNDNTKMIEKGRLAFRSVVDSTVTLIVADIVAGNEGNLAPHFAPLLAEVGAGNTTNLALLSKSLTDFFAANTGGGTTNTYSGLNMVDAHNPEVNPRMGKKSTDADYTRFVGFVGQAAGKNGVTDPIILNEVVSVLESLRAPIVQE